MQQNNPNNAAISQVMLKRITSWGRNSSTFCLSSDSGSAEGWYMCADGSNGGYGQTTDLQTPVISSTGPQCTLVFWYYMSGFTVGSLQVRRVKNTVIQWAKNTRWRGFHLADLYLQVLLKYGNVTREVWSQTGNQGNKWRRGEVFLGLLNNFQVCNY